ncbi:hypothetical protein GBK02_13080 [Dechloromonas sp. TW-R-39-2]|uniref:hypothetical protein n=1 Tax=Dechloromonas sp. TW-R-39-2 TaxID=2654218 RepID=UPI00193E2311|nr:hypothetical protein [Dechloromonas sp. TW-R-39-2]QRM20260.1 hypothetical protein GBK02_13080 [Dechloromonas sp. TW-R-39-2]
MRRIFLPLSLVFLCGISHAGILPEAQREELLSLVLQNFWGKAKLSNGQFAQPTSEKDRITVPISRAVANRAFDVGEVSGLAEWCGLDWQSNYTSLTGGARNRGFSDKQVAFVSFLHGAAQGHIASAMSKSGACSSQDRTKIEQLFNQSKARGLDGT